MKMLTAANVMTTAATAGKNGKYTYESTFEQAVQANIPFWIKDFDGDIEAARAKIIEVFKGLKRWKS